jgi:hypothetical protein
LLATGQFLALVMTEVMESGGRCAPEGASAGAFFAFWRDTLNALEEPIR